VNELAKTELNIEIIWRAFELRPEPAPTLPPDGEYLHRVCNSSVYPRAESLGMPIKLAPAFCAAKFRAANFLSTCNAENKPKKSNKQKGESPFACKI